MEKKTNKNLFTVIDIGSMNASLNIFEKKQVFKLIREEHKIILYDNKTKNDNLSRLMEVIDEYLLISRKKFVPEQNIIVFGTQSLRIKHNAVVISDHLKKYNLNLRVLTGYEEAYFNTIAIKESCLSRSNFIAFDIGGGSIELSFFNKSEIRFFCSLNFGLKEYTDSVEKFVLFKRLKNEFDCLNSLINKETKLILTGLIPRNLLYLLKVFFGEENPEINFHDLLKLTSIMKTVKNSTVVFKEINNYSVSKSYILATLDLLKKITFYFDRNLYCCENDLKFGLLFELTRGCQLAGKNM